MSGENDRSERLAAALRANIARRKAQARARKEVPDSGTAAPDHAPAGENPASEGSKEGAAGAPPIVPDGEAG